MRRCRTFAGRLSRIAPLHVFLVLSRLGFADRGGSRPIQLVGTPYYGTPLAGSLAYLYETNLGCGSNPDLTYGGASTWMSDIPT
jgi:hypothetical protein